MDQGERLSSVLRFRKETINGKIIYLKPLTKADSGDIVRLRNKPRNRYFLSQSCELTVADQERWFEGYDKKNNDIYWGIYKKGTDTFLGTIRLYGIDPNGRSCEEGSYMIDEDYADEAPYAVESKMLALDTAFDGLQIKTVVNDNRSDNKVMNGIDDRLGFDKGSIRQINNVSYRHRSLTAEDYHENRIRFSDLIDYWSVR